MLVREGPPAPVPPHKHYPGDTTRGAYVVLRTRLEKAIFVAALTLVALLALVLLFPG